MANKSAGIYIRMEPELKERAKTVSENIGISLSSAITIMVKQYIVNNGFPFQVTGKPIEKPIDFFSLSEDEQIKELEKSLDELKRGKGKKAEDAFYELDEEIKKL